MKILVVDDDSVFRNLIKHFCNQAECTFYELSNGHNAIVAVIDHEIELVLLDILMEGKEGFKTLEEIKTYCEVPVVMVSSDKFYLDVSKDLGADGTVLKPVTYNDFLKIIENYGQGKNRISNRIEETGP